MSRSRSRWGPEGPPDEAYSRLTNPERFLPLHEAALELIERLRADYDVEMTEGYDPIVSGIGEDGLARPSVRLNPSDSACAPITVAFTNFPGLIVKFGKWKEERFPDCGCDACDEDADEEIEYMTEIFESVIAGGFLEAVRVPYFGDGWVGSALSDLKSPMTEAERAAWLEHYRKGRNQWEVFSESALMNYEMLSQQGVKRARALEMSGGRLYLEFDWKPWPSRDAVFNP